MLRHVAQLAAIMTDIRHLMRNDQMLLIVNGRLHVIANGATAPTTN